MTDCKYPEIKVELIGKDGNAFVILGAVNRSLRQAGIPADEITMFYNDATSGDYNHLLSVVQEWVTVTGTDQDDEEENEEDDFDEDEFCPHCLEDINFCICDDEDYLKDWDEPDEEEDGQIEDEDRAESDNNNDREDWREENRNSLIRDCGIN